MGFQAVYLLGCETTSYGHAYLDPSEPQEREEEMQVKVRKCTAVAREVYTAKGMTLIDCSGPTGTLPLTRLPLREVIGG